MTTDRPLPSTEDLRQRLPGALVRQEMGLSYIPQVCLSSGKVVAADVVLDWTMPDSGKVAAESFLPLITELGLDAEFLRWMLREAGAQGAAWRREGLPSFRLYVGTWSPVWLSGDLNAWVRDAMAETGMSADGLAIGVAASAVLEDPAKATAALDALQRQGVETVVWGFGEGLADLSVLGRLPVDMVRIGRSLITSRENEALPGPILPALIQFARGMCWRVLVDATSSEEQVRLLADLGCDFAQGSHLGSAVDAQGFATLSGRSLTSPHAAAQPSARVRTLLLVDDEDNILSSLRRLFRRDGYRVLTATSGMQALEVLAENAVDVILSDQRMPGMTGVDFLRKAKRLYPDTVRMTLSGYTDLQSIIDAVNEGAVYKFLTKPWEDDRLRDHVAKAFRQRELVDENQHLGQELGKTNRELANANQRLERMVNVENERRRAMQAAAGASRDMLDLLPMAVFGVGSEGMLAYANQCAIHDWPSWAAALGEAPDPTFQDLLKASDDAVLKLGDSDGMALGIEGRQVTVWKRSLMGDQGTLGSLLILHVAKSKELHDMEPSA